MTSSSLVRVIGKNSPLRSSAMKGGSTYQVWSHSDKHRRSFIELCSSDVITAKWPACLMYYYYFFIILDSTPLKVQQTDTCTYIGILVD